MKELLTKSIFTGGFDFLDLLLEYTYPWEAIGNIRKIIDVAKGRLDGNYTKIGEDVYVFKGVSVPSSAKIVGPAIIMEGAEIRHGAYLRGGVIVGKGAVVGNSTEIKDSVLFDKACAPHYNYIGNSMIGKGAHLGAGAIISNLKGNKTSVSISYNGQKIDTGLRKLGAILGENVEVGCGTVLNPGTIVLENTQIYPLSSIRGTLGANLIYKSSDKIVKKADK